VTGLIIEKIAIANLSFDPENARSHDEKNLNAICASLDAFGQRKPVVVTATNVIVAGNGTVMAAQQLGWAEIDIVRVPEDWSDNQIKAFALADNRTAELAKWDISVLEEHLSDLEVAGFEVENFGFELANFEPVPVEEQPRFDERAKQGPCPNCGTQWRVGTGGVIEKL